ncbi:fimbrial assembly protein [Deinococcus petrolearius]|uniref:Fimbrial assembly protein n=1 Tax=Deinococcus petrolearius TaxID=1751295 RepID=A0ABW1DHU3_9DEIO
MVEINLLPAQYRRQSQPGVWKYATWALLPVAAVTMLGLWLATSSQAGRLQREIDAVQGNIDTLTPARQERDRLAARQRELEQVTTVAQTLRGLKTYWSNDLAAFSTQLAAAPGVSVSSLTMRTLDAGALATSQQSGVYAGKNVRRELDLSGAASSQQAVINFLNSYENDPDFGVNFRSLQRDAQSGDYTFAATVGVVGPSVGDAPATGTGAPAAGTPAPAAAPAAAPAPTGGSNVR